MAREYEGFRAQIEQLNELFPGRELITIKEVSELTGYGSVNTVKKMFHFVNGRILKVELARRLCEIYQGKSPPIFVGR